MGVRPLMRRGRTVWRHILSRENRDNENEVHMSSVEGDKGSTEGDMGRPPSYSSSEPQNMMPDLYAQHGVQDVEAVTITWSKRTLIAVFVKYVMAPGTPCMHMCACVEILRN